MTRLDPNHPAVKAARGAKSATDAYRVGDDIVVTAEQGALMWAIRITWGEDAVVPEYRFRSTRRWRFDLAMPNHMIAIEIEGGLYVQGRHTRGKDFERDAEKYAEAMCDGWRVLRVSPGQVDSGQALGWLRRIVDREETVG